MILPVKDVFVLLNAADKIIATAALTVMFEGIDDDGCVSIEVDLLDNLQAASNALKHSIKAIPEADVDEN